MSKNEVHARITHGLTTLTKAVRALRGPTKLKKINRMILRSRPVSNKDLQRVTKCVSYIGQPVSDARALYNHRYHVAQKFNVTSHCSLYISVHDDEHSAEIFFRPEGSHCSSEFIAPHVFIALLMSLAKQYGAPLEKVGDLLAGAKFAPCGPVSGHDRIKSRRSLPNLIGRHQLGAHWGRHELAHVQDPPVKEESP